MHLFRFALLALLFVVLPAAAQGIAAGGSAATENVRLDYAQVLNVSPVYETLRASRSEMRCEEVAAPKPAPVADEGRWSKMVDAVKGVFTRDPEPEPRSAGAPKANCRMVPVQREFQRPIAYDVDYVYKGTKYRSRLAEDPGNRLRIRVSVMPYIPGQTVALP
jgi:uncharacterized protein YcfJ